MSLVTYPMGQSIGRHARVNDLPHMSASVTATHDSNRVTDQFVEGIGVALRIPGGGIHEKRAPVLFEHEVIDHFTRIASFALGYRSDTILAIGFVTQRMTHWVGSFPHQGALIEHGH